MSKYDLIIKGGRLVIPNYGVTKGDIGICGEKIAAIADDIAADEGIRVIDAEGKHVFPGAVDSHFHIGIYRPFSQDARSESASAASGGITTLVSYFRTGKSYLNKVGPFKEIFPELMELSGNSFITDYGYHIALMTSEQLDEMEWLVKECGVCTFKYYMFYKKLDLSGSAQSGGYLMLEDTLDLGFLYKYMKKVAALNEEYKDKGGVSLSIHCENPEIITATMDEVKANSCGNFLKDYSNSRPGWQEALAINEVGVIANQTNCPVNLLHLTSKEAVDAAKKVKADYSHLKVLMEATLHHLSLSNDNDYGILGKVNPPVRDQKDVDYLWDATIKGDIETIVSDHACTTKELKKGDLWTSMPGFGGTSLMFPVLISEGHHKRGLSLQRIAELSSFNSAVAHNLYPKKGTLMVGGDADIAIVDLDEEKEITQELLCTAQDFSPFIGMKLKGWPEHTILRGKVIFENGHVVGEPGYGEYIKRPVKAHQS